MQPPWPYDPSTKMVDLTHPSLLTNDDLQIIGIPVKLDPDMPFGRIDYYENSKRFCCAPGEWHIDNFITLYHETRKVIPMKNDEPHYDGTPLQDQIEKADKRIAELEDICEKGLDLVTALIQEKAELSNDVYQAQLDAQDWQNKYHELADKTTVKHFNSLVRRMFAISTHNARLVKDNRELSDTLVTLRAKSLLTVHERDLTEQLFAAQGRVSYLTDQNTELELRNERQSKRALRAKDALDGAYDDKAMFLLPEGVVTD